MTPISRTGSAGAPDGAAALEGDVAGTRLIALHDGGKYDGFRYLDAGGRGMRRRKQGGPEFRAMRKLEDGGGWGKGEGLIGSG